MAIVKEKTNIENANLIIAEIEKRDKVVKLDNFLTVLNLENFDIEKIKVLSIQDGSEKTDVKYGAPTVNELYVLEFRNVEDIKEFKVKGRINDNKFNILFNFTENILQIKVEYGNGLNEKDVEKIIEKF